MGTPFAGFRENPSRALYVVGEINQGMVDRLTPHILALRAAATEPITVYIDSLGGSTFHARLLINLLTAPNQDGHRCSTITVVTGTAASAAADILAAGGYAIAYRHASIHYHGVRTSFSEITHESASSLAETLKESNESFALELANRVKGRFFFRYTQIRAEMEAALAASPNRSTVECLAHALGTKVVGGSRLLEEALKKHQRLNRLLAEYNVRLGEAGQAFARPAEQDAFLLTFLVEWELRENTNPAWRFGSLGLTAMREDFVLLADYEDGQHMRRLEREISQWGQLLLTPEQGEEYANLNGEAATSYLLEHKREEFRALWHFLISVCRALQQGENPLSPADAYWLGLVDEVPGSGLTSVREVFENYSQVVEKTPVALKPKSTKIRSIAAKAARKPKSTSRARAKGAIR